jgi:malonate-semialdehyde dehydrogenase (acetylating)/methylmalonate-semialdehyde dehydrogenase
MSPLRMLAHRLRSRLFSTSSARKALSSKSLQSAENISAKWKGTSALGHPTKNFIGGKFEESKAQQWFDVLDPVRFKACILSEHLYKVLVFSQHKLS